jgi:hypothetical protein
VGKGRNELSYSRRAWVTRLAPIAVGALLAWPSLTCAASDDAAYRVTIFTPNARLSAPLIPSVAAPASPQAPAIAEPIPVIDLDVGPGVAIPAVRPLVIDSDLSRPVFHINRDPNEDEILVGSDAPQGPPPQLIDSPPSSASLQGNFGHSGMRLVLPVARILRSLSDTSNQ